MVANVLSSLGCMRYGLSLGWHMRQDEKDRKDGSASALYEKGEGMLATLRVSLDLELEVQ